MILADTSLTFEPAYPWSIPTIGPVTMLAVALALTALTVWTYVGVAKATIRRVAAVVILRLAALAIAFCILLRPSIAMTQLDGVEESKVLLVVDHSKSMNIAESDGKPTRWQQVADILQSSTVERRLRELAQEEKIEFVKYLGARDLRPFEKDASPDGVRTDIGAWLHQLWTKHANDKRVRAIALLSDGADNGTRFSATDKARAWRGIAPIHAFGVGDPTNAKFKKDLALTKIDVKPEPIFIKTPMRIEAAAQAPGFAKTDFEGAITIDDARTGKNVAKQEVKVRINNEKDQPLRFDAEAPAEPGEYKITLKLEPHAEESDTENNEISTYVQVIKEKINVLWVDRPRVYEPRLIIQLALAPEERLKIKYVALRPGFVGDPMALYDFRTRYDVIVIGDISAEQFTLGKPDFLKEIHKTVTKNKTGLLMLGGSETFTNGGWREHPEFMSLLPVDFDLKDKKSTFGPTSSNPISIEPTKLGLIEPFGQLDPNPETNLDIWTKQFVLSGLPPVGRVVDGSTVMLQSKGKEPILVITKKGEGRVAVFAGDSTATNWLGSPEAARGFVRFWKQLVFWLADQKTRENQLVVKLDKRRMTDDPGDMLGFTMSLRDKDGNEVPRARYEARVMFEGAAFPVTLAADGKRGSFQGPKKIGEHTLVVEANASDGKKNLQANESVRFLVAPDRTETLRPLAEHETLIRIASASDGRFHPAQEAAFLQFLDDLASQVKREGRVRTTNWPSWNRLPASEHPRDQLFGLWHSFALFGFLIFVTLLGMEWLLRRMWGMA